MISHISLSHEDSEIEFSSPNAARTLAECLEATATASLNGARRHAHAWCEAERVPADSDPSCVPLGLENDPDSDSDSDSLRA